MSAMARAAESTRVADGTRVAEGADTARVADSAQAGDHVSTARGTAWRVALGLVWTVAVVLAYYAVHKPYTAADLAALRAPALGAAWDGARMATHLAGEVADLIAAAWTFVLAGALGQVIWRASRFPDRESPEARLIGTVLGLGALGLAAFAAGLLGLLTPLVAWGLLLIPALVLARAMVAQAHWWARAGRAWWGAAWHGGRTDRAIAIYAAATLTLAGLAALLPPTTAWDALSYHLVGVRADATAGHLVLDPSNPALYHPRLVEGLYTLLWLVRGGDGPLAPLHATAGVLAVALVAVLGLRAAGPRGAVRAAGLALGMPVLALLASWPYVDLSLAAAALGALVAVVCWGAARARRDRGAARGWLVAGAIAGGLALDVKYSGGYVVTALAALVAIATCASTSRTIGNVRGLRACVRRGLVPAGGFLTLAVLVGSPWMVRNLIVTGDPIFPLHVGALFPLGPGWDPVRTRFMDGTGWGWSALWRAPLVPVEATVLGRQYTSEFDADIGPQLLLLLPLGFLARDWRRAPKWRAAPPAPGRAASPSVRAWRWPLAFAGLLLVIWGVELARTALAAQSRIFLPLFLAACVPAAVAWIRLDAVRTPTVSLGRFASAAIALCLALGILAQAARTLQVDNLAELAGMQVRQTYLAQQLGPYAAAMRELNTLGPDAHVLLLWEPRGYLTTAHVAPDIYLDNFNVLYRRCGAAVGITRCLRQSGFTHVLVYEQGLRLVVSSGKDSPGELAELATLRADWHPIYHDDTPLFGGGPPRDGWYVLYAIGGGA